MPRMFFHLLRLFTHGILASLALATLPVAVRSNETVPLTVVLSRG